MTQYFGGACCVSLSEQRLLACLLGHCYSCLRFRCYWLGAASLNPLREQARPSLGQGERPGWARCRRSSLRPRLVCALPSKALDSFCRVPSCVLTSRPSLASKLGSGFAARVGSSAFGAPQERRPRPTTEDGLSGFWRASDCQAGEARSLSAAAGLEPLAVTRQPWRQGCSGPCSGPISAGV